MPFWPNVLSMLKIASKHSRERDRPPTIEETIQETAKTHLAKQGKIELATDAIYTEDLRQLARDDRDKVRDYERRLWGGRQSARKEEGMSDLIVCDDYRRGLNPWVVTALAAMAGAVMLGREWLATPSPDQPAPTEVSSTEDQNTQYQLQFVEPSKPDPGLL